MLCLLHELKVLHVLCDNYSCVFVWYREKTRELMLSQPTGRLSSLDENSVSEGQCIEEEEEDHYFSSYGHFSIHEEMLKVLMAKK